MALTMWLGLLIGVCLVCGLVFAWGGRAFVTGLEVAFPSVGLWTFVAGVLFAATMTLYESLVRCYPKSKAVEAVFVAVALLAYVVLQLRK